MPPRRSKPPPGADEPGREALALPGAHSYEVTESEIEPRPGGSGSEGKQTIELREEQLVAHKDLRERGEVRVRTTADLEELIRRLREKAEVVTRTTVVLSVPFEGRPLDPGSQPG